VTLPAILSRLHLPVIGAPLFIISNPGLVIAKCTAGIVGSFPSLNARPASQLDEWLHEISEALAAHDQLRAEGIAIRVIDAYSLQPIDTDTMLAAAKATGGAVITVEDHYSAGGLGDAVSEAIASAGFGVKRLCVREIPRSGLPDELLDRYGISARHVVDAVRAVRKP
jgi:hypothetical protein